MGDYLTNGDALGTDAVVVVVEEGEDTGTTSDTTDIPAGPTPTTSTSAGHDDDTEDDDHVLADVSTQAPPHTPDLSKSAQRKSSSRILKGGGSFNVSGLGLDGGGSARSRPVTSLFLPSDAALERTPLHIGQDRTVRHPPQQINPTTVVINGERHQLVISSLPQPASESRQGGSHVTVRRAKTVGDTIVFVKILYTYTLVVLAAWYVSFGLMLLVELAVGIVAGGFQDPDANSVTAVLSLFSLPVFLVAITDVITLCMGMLVDVWHNFEYFHTFTTLPLYLREWALMLLVLLVPMLTWTFALLSGNDDAAAIGLLSFFFCSTALFACGAFLVVREEVRVSLMVIRGDNRALASITKKENDKETISLWDAVRALSWQRAIQQLSFEALIPFSLIADVSDGNPDDEIKAYIKQSESTCYSTTEGRFSSLLRNRSALYTRRARPCLVRNREAVSHGPILTTSEDDTQVNQLYFFLFASRRTRGRISPTVAWSSLACTLLTFLIILLQVIGYMVFFQFSQRATWGMALLTLCFLAIFLVYRVVPMFRQFRSEKNSDGSTTGGGLGGTAPASTAYPSAAAGTANTTSPPNKKSSRAFISAALRYLAESAMYSASGERRAVAKSPEAANAAQSPRTASVQMNVDTEVEDAINTVRENPGLHNVRVRYAEPTVGFAWFVFGLTVIFLFLMPLVCLWTLTTGYAVIFLVSCLFTLFRFIFSIHRTVDGSLPSPARLDMMFPTHALQRRYFLVVSRMVRRKTAYVGWVFFVIAGFIVFMLVIGSYGTDEALNGKKDPPAVYNATDFQIFPNDPEHSGDGMLYPTCDLASAFRGLNISAGLSDVLYPDFAYLAVAAYIKGNMTQIALDNYFGPGVIEYVISSTDIQDEGSITKETTSLFKLFKVKSSGALIISVRGTSNLLDLLNDALLWFPAVCMQVLRSLLPLGWIWTPALPYLVDYFRVLDTPASKKARYYTDVVAFIEKLQSEDPDATIILTGHSLGGGVAMIAGALAEVPAIGFSGPNTMLSWRRFGIASVEDVSLYTFNLLPQRDVIPMVDDVALLTNNILCRANTRKGVTTCHQSMRTFCELQDKCGSQGRAPVQDCVTKYGYPEPTPV